MKTQKPHPDWWRVYEGEILRANQSTEVGAMYYMKPGRVLVTPTGERFGLTPEMKSGYHPGSDADPRD